MDDNRSDEQLIADYLKGDQPSLEVLIKRYIKPIYSFACRYVNDTEATEDITQEVFVKAWRHIKKFDQSKSFKTWIFSIAKNTAMDFLKKKKTIPFSAFDTENGNAVTDKLADPSSLPQILLERSGAAQMLNAAREKILPKYGTVLSMHYNERLNFREIAEKLGEPLNTIKSRHRRALILLKRFFAAS